MNSTEKGICFDFLKGVCCRGPLCRFSHDLSTLQAPQRSESARRRHAPICYDFVKSQCTRGEDCRYSHDYTSVLLGAARNGQQPGQQVQQVPQVQMQAQAQAHAQAQAQAQIQASLQSQGDGRRLGSARAQVGGFSVGSARRDGAATPRVDQRAEASAAGGSRATAPGIVLTSRPHARGQQGRGRMRDPTTICVDFTRGRCRRGDACRYAHVVPAEHDGGQTSSGLAQAGEGAGAFVDPESILATLRAAQTSAVFGSSGADQGLLAALGVEQPPPALWQEMQQGWPADAQWAGVPPRPPSPSTDAAATSSRDAIIAQLLRLTEAQKAQLQCLRQSAALAGQATPLGLAPPPPTEALAALGQLPRGSSLEAFGEPRSALASSLPLAGISSNVASFGLQRPSQVDAFGSSREAAEAGGAAGLYGAMRTSSGAGALAAGLGAQQGAFGLTTPYEHDAFGMSARAQEPRATSRPQTAPSIQQPSARGALAALAAAAAQQQQQQQRVGAVSPDATLVQANWGLLPSSASQQASRAASLAGSRPPTRPPSAGTSPREGVAFDLSALGATLADVESRASLSDPPLPLAANPSVASLGRTDADSFRRVIISAAQAAASQAAASQAAASQAAQLLRHASSRDKVARANLSDPILKRTLGAADAGVALDSPTIPASWAPEPQDQEHGEIPSQVAELALPAGFFDAAIGGAEDVTRRVSKSSDHDDQDARGASGLDFLHSIWADTSH